jgi:lactoylglutathione lyase
MAQKPVLDHFALYVVDLKKSTQLYSEVMQLDTIAEPFHDGKHAWFSIGPGLQLHLIEGAVKTAEPPKRNHICFSFPALGLFTDRLAKAGIAWEDLQGKTKGITKRPDGVQQIYFRDPDGYWIEANDAAGK